MPNASRILVIEDDLLFRRAIQLLLAEIGKEIVLAENGRSGLEAASHQSVDLIFCDFRLGDMRGDEVIRQLKANPATSHIPIVLMTGHRAAVDEASTEADYHLAKPFQVRDLIGLIGQIEAPSTSSGSISL